MNHLWAFLINIFLTSVTCFAERTFLGIQEEGKHKTYSFKIDDATVSISCNKLLGKSYCETRINDTLRSHNSEVKFEDDFVKSVNAFSQEKNLQVQCSNNLSESSLACSTSMPCSRSIKIDAIINRQGEGVAIGICRDKFKDQKKETVLCAKNIQNNITDNIDIEGKIRKNCSNLDEIEIKNLVTNFRKILDTEGLFEFKKKCLATATDSNSKLISEVEKNIHVSKLAQSIVSYIENNFKDCKSKSSPLFYEEKLDFDRFVCLKSNDIAILGDVNCNYSSQESNSSTRNIQTNASLSQAARDASRDSAANNDKKLSELDKPTIMDTPAEIAKPIPVKQTLVQIDKMVQDNGGTVSPEIAEKAGKLFNDSVYEPTRSAIQYIDNKVFKSNETSSAQYRSGNVASTSGKRYQIGGNRNPASKQTATARKSGSGSSASTAGVMGEGVGPAAAASSGAIKSALGEEKDNQNSGGKAAIVDSKNSAKDIPLNNESQRPGTSGQQTNNSFVPNTASGTSGKDQDFEKSQLSSKASAEVNQLVGQIKTVESAEDLKSVLGLEENQEALRHLVKPAKPGQDRSPASAADPLINKLNEYNIKLYDERTGKTIYSPEKTEYIMRLSDKGVRLLKPIGGTKK